MKSKRTPSRRDRDDRHSHGGGDERSIEQILARRRIRKRRRRHTHAPDCLHGEVRIDAIYETFGAEWVESTAFVQVLRGAGGRRLGWSVATYDEGFVTLAHGVEGEVPDCEVWLHEELGEIERVVLLDVGASEEPPDLEVPASIPVRTDRTRLLELERRHLSVTRDRDFGRGRGRANEAVRDERLLESRIDLMSLIGLCATLVERNR